MSASELVSATLGIPEPSARFLLGLFGGYPLAILYRAIIANQSSRIQNVYFTVSGLAVLWYIYGITVWHSLLDVVLVYVVLLVFGASQVSVLLTWVITMGHLVCGYIYVMYSEQVHPISWTIPHCVLVLKLIGVANNVCDGKKISAKQSYEQKVLSVSRMPSFLELLGFSYFFGSQLAGPQVSFKRHLLFTEGKLFDWNQVPSSVPAGAMRLLVGVAFAVLYSLSNQYFPVGFVMTDDFLNSSFPLRLFYMVICGRVALWRYISVWVIAEGSCIWTSISYERTDYENGLDVLCPTPPKSGRGSGSEKKGEVVGWHALTNIKILDFELGASLESGVDCFNVNTNNWVLWYVFKRLRFLGNKTLSWSITMAFIALWHGVWPGYYITFSLEMLEIMAERKVRSFCYRLFGRSLEEVPFPVQVLVYICAYVIRNLLFMYPLVTFMILDWHSCFQFMKSMYFFCHVVVLGWLILYQFLPKPRVPLSSISSSSSHNGTGKGLPNGSPASVANGNSSGSSNNGTSNGTSLKKKKTH